MLAVCALKILKQPLLQVPKCIICYLTELVSRKLECELSCKVAGWYQETCGCGMGDYAMSSTRICSSDFSNLSGYACGKGFQKLVLLLARILVFLSAFDCPNSKRGSCRKEKLVFIWDQIVVILYPSV